MAAFVEVHTNHPPGCTGVLCGCASSQSLRLFSCPAPAPPESHSGNWKHGPFFLPKPPLLPDSLLPLWPPAPDLFLVTLHPPIHFSQSNDGGTRAASRQSASPLRPLMLVGVGPAMHNIPRGPWGLRRVWAHTRGEALTSLASTISRGPVPSPRPWVSPGQGWEAVVQPP